MRAAPITWVMAMWPIVAIAQETTPGDLTVLPSAESAETLPAPIQETRAFGDGWRWVTTSPRNAGTREFVALSSPGAGSSQVLALDGDGGVWRSEDGGRTWQRTLAPLRGGAQHLPSEEDVLLEAEVISGDLPDFDEFFDFSLEGTEDELEAALERSQQERESLDALDLQEQLGLSQSGESTRFAGSLSHSPGEWTVVLAARPDGIWRSEDAGDSFTRVDERWQISRFAWRGTEFVVGGSRAGLVVSTDGGLTWKQGRGAGEDLRVYDVQQDAELGWWAATDGGLLQSADGVRWRFASGSQELVGIEVSAIAIKEGSVWLSTGNAVLRSDDQGESFLPISRQYLPGVRVLLTRKAAGALLTSTADGVWETLDGGTRWRPVSFGLREPETLDLAEVEDTLLLATQAGLYRLVEESDKPADEPGDIFSMRGPPLGPLVDAVLHRPGVDPAMSGVSPRRSALSRLLPEVNVDFQYVDRRNLSVDFIDRSNALDTDNDWRVMARLSWGYGPESDPSSTALASSEFSDLYYVLRGEVFAADDPQAVHSAASRLTTGSTQYRVQLSEEVAILYYSRERLARSIEGASSGGLHQAVHRQLDLQELTARIDAYTEGALTRALQGS